MRSEEQCLLQAEFLEGLAKAEPDAGRHTAYAQMAAYWRALAKVRQDRPLKPSGFGRHL